jgi:hypothetical protein
MRRKQHAPLPEQLVAVETRPDVRFEPDSVEKARGGDR